VIDPPPDGRPVETYSERLRTPWWWYLAAVVVAVLLGAEFAIVVSGWIAALPFVVLVPLCLLVVWRLSSPRVAVAADTLTAGERSVPLELIEAAIGLTAGELRRLVGRHADPTCYSFIRSWIGPGVQLVLRPADPRPDGPTDPELPTEPYWVVSTRHPDRLLAALAAASVPVS
jgi:hypothetical protein